jgi:transposase
MLNLPSLAIEQTAETATQYDFTATVKSALPPCCLDGVVLNGTKQTMFRDLPIHGRHVRIWVNRQKYKCKGCGKTLYQTVPHMHRQHEMTLRLVDYFERNSMDRNFSALAGELGLREFSVRNIFRVFAKRELTKLEPVTPEWMGLDELYILSKFRGVVTNVKDRTLVDMLPNRSKVAVIRYLAGIDDREKIRLVAIDMWNPYREAIREVLPHARIVVDKFHVVRMANEDLERIRKEHRVSLPVRGRLQLKDDRWMMLTNPDKLDSERMLLLEAMLGQFPMSRRVMRQRSGSGPSGVPMACRRPKKPTTDGRPSFLRMCGQHSTT